MREARLPVCPRSPGLATRLTPTVPGWSDAKNYSRVMGHSRLFRRLQATVLNSDPDDLATLDPTHTLVTRLSRTRRVERW